MLGANRRVVRRAIIAISAPALVGVAACSESTSAGMGTVGVRLTNESVTASVGAVSANVSGSDSDSPLPTGSVKSVDIFVVRIDAKREEPSDDDAAAETEDSDSEKGGWMTVAEPNA